MGLHGEIYVEIDLGEANRVELRAGRASHGQASVLVAYDPLAGRLTFADKHADFKLAPSEKTLNLRLFVDGCIGELYINERACFGNILPVDKLPAFPSWPQEARRAPKRFHESCHMPRLESSDPHRP